MLGATDQPLMLRHSVHTKLLGLALSVSGLLPCNDPRLSYMSCTFLSSSYSLYTVPSTPNSCGDRRACAAQCDTTLQPSASVSRVLSYFCLLTVNSYSIGLRNTRLIVYRIVHTKGQSFLIRRDTTAICGKKEPQAVPLSDSY